MKSVWHDWVRFTRRGIDRRRFLQTAAASSALAGTFSLRDLVGLKAAELRKQQRSIIVLWMAGGPSQLETMDPKPDHANGGSTRAISTSVPGVQIAQGWEQTARLMEHFAVLRSLTNKEGNHRRATYQLHTGYIPSGSVKHPSLGSHVIQQIGNPDLAIPSLVSIGQPDGAGAGFLGVQYEPFYVNNPGTLPENTTSFVSATRSQQRHSLLNRLQLEYASRGAAEIVQNQQTIYQKAAEMIQSPDLQAFSIDDEPEALKAAYGDSKFGRGCLLARRLVERGVSYVEVGCPGWDTHFDNFEQTTALAGVVDPAMATLITDLETRGLLENTLVVWMGEFGRTPRVNGRGGRDHFPRVFNALLAGAGIQGGQVIGSSSADGMEIADRPVSIPDLFRSICHAVNVDADFENISSLGRPMKIVEGGEVVQELFS